MRRAALCASAVGALALVAGASATAQGTWTIPPGADRLASPVTTTPAVLRKGADLFHAQCEKCHGPTGAGNGPYADPAHRPANLAALDVASTSDGALFYKVWNGRSPMPAFKSTLTADEVWTVVAYVKTLSSS